MLLWSHPNLCQIANVVRKQKINLITAFPAIANMEQEEERFFFIKNGIIVITVITIIANMDKGEEFFLYLRHHKHCRMEYDRLLGELQKMHDEQDMEGEHIQAQVFIFIAISGQDDRWNSAMT